MDPQSVPCRVWRRRADGGWARADDELAAEEPLEIRVAGRPVCVTMRTPGHDEELAAGFLLGEGIIRGPGDLVRMRRCEAGPGDAVDALLAPTVAVDFARLTRHVFASSSCGVCGAVVILKPLQSSEGLKNLCFPKMHETLPRKTEILPPKTVSG